MAPSRGGAPDVDRGGHHRGRHLGGSGRGRRAATSRKATAADEFAIASITKTFTAALVLRLAEQRQDRPRRASRRRTSATSNVDTNGATVRQALEMRAGTRRHHAGCRGADPRQMPAHRLDDRGASSASSARPSGRCRRALQLLDAFELRAPRRRGCTRDRQVTTRRRCGRSCLTRGTPTGSSPGAGATPRRSRGRSRSRPYLGRVRAPADVGVG